jgi:hypothetical protein
VGPDAAGLQPGEHGVSRPRHPVRHGPSRARAAQEQQLTLPRSARFQAAAFVAFADALIACWDAKYHFNFWRPVTAIRQGDADGNDPVARMSVALLRPTRRRRRLAAGSIDWIPRQPDRMGAVRATNRTPAIRILD